MTREELEVLAEKRFGHGREKYIFMEGYVLGKESSEGELELFDCLLSEAYSALLDSNDSWDTAGSEKTNKVIAAAREWKGINK